MASALTLTARLERASAWTINVWAGAAAFTAYFAAYGFRKPFLAAEFAGVSPWLGGLTLKTTFVISQVFGYALSKYLGVGVCSQAERRRLPWMLLALVATAEAALLGFAILPVEWKPVALFANGLALGMVWGGIVRFLEGRRSSDVLLAVLCSSYVISSGVVKDVGRTLMGDFQVSELWMPATTGLLFFAPFALAVWALARLPPPDEADVAERSARSSMSSGGRTEFLRSYGAGLALLCGVYLLLTACRDFRDNYGIEILGRLGYGNVAGVFTQTEFPVALGVLGSLGALNLIRRNRKALAAAFALMIGGVGLVGASTLLLEADQISGLTWLTLTGLGIYLAYTPYNAILFDRLWASTRSVGTAVFAIYIADAVGYTGSVGVQIYKDLWAPDANRFEFFRTLCYVVSVVGAIGLSAAGIYFVRRSEQT